MSLDFSTRENEKTADFPLIEVFESQRKYPRIEMALEARVALSDKSVLPVIVRNISPCGVQIRASRAVAQKLNPAGKPIIAVPRPVVAIELKLDIGAGVARCVIPSAVNYATPSPGGHIALGLTFVNMKPDHAKLLDRYFNHILHVPPPVTPSPA